MWQYPQRHRAQPEPYPDNMSNPATAGFNAAARDNAEARTLHPFYNAGMGEGPYTFAGCFDMGEAMNPNSAANFGNMRGWVSNAPRLVAGLGTCVCCGKGISIICIVRNAAGELYGVGSDCIEKIDNAGIYRNGVKAALAIRATAKRRAAAAAKRAKQWEAERPAREAAQIEANARALAECKERYAGMQRNAAIIAHLYGAEALELPGRQLPDGNGWAAHVYLDQYSGFWMGGGGFRADMLATLLNGTPPHAISDRARRILADIKATTAGRRNSKAYDAAFDEAMALLFP